MKSRLLGLPSRIRSHKQVVVDFADEFGLVYFGNVDQHGDEHQIVRGMTVSNAHKDAHYAIGTYESYDVAFVERQDTLLNMQNTKRRHTWYILQFDLHTKIELPHVFIGLHSHSESFYTHLFTKYTHLRPINLGSVYPHSPEFLMHYRVFTTPSRHIDTEKLFDSTIDAAFLQNFKSLAIELIDGTLYVYAENMSLTPTLLEAMIKNGTWLAGHIDRLSKNL